MCSFFFRFLANTAEMARGNVGVFENDRVFRRELESHRIGGHYLNRERDYIYYRFRKTAQYATGCQSPCGTLLVNADSNFKSEDIRLRFCENPFHLMRLTRRAAYLPREN